MMTGGTSLSSLSAQRWPGQPAEAFHGLAGRVAMTIEPHTEADPVAILVQLLLAFGNQIGPRPHCQVEADRHRGNLFVALVGETSRARKGTSWARPAFVPTR